MPDSERFDMSVSAHDVATELRLRFRHDPGVLKIHKLLYYAQGWHLAWCGQPLFAEPIEAWTKGPVVADLWRNEKYENGRPTARPLDGDALATLEYVLDRYGALSGRELIRSTHNEDPWREVSESDDAWSVINPEITHEALRRWFTSDAEFVARSAEVERLRESNVYSFAPMEITDEFESAIDRAVRGERVRHSRPA